MLAGVAIVVAAYDLAMAGEVCACARRRAPCCESYRARMIARVLVNELREQLLSLGLLNTCRGQETNI